ncbi:hypothetical protein ACIA49_38510 [Kribbella sp. NPDC051587]|uniref:hypothetical protein n=1 Tax=Kribbella sp. NPDC051587 TaxID=3364119 RepID=UPI0037A9E1DF
MVSDDTSPGRHTARKNAARALAAASGISYTAALRQVAKDDTDRQPRLRWVLTDDVRAWFAGEGWIGVQYPDLYAWLDDEVQPTYDCDWCGQPGDARSVDSSIVLTIAAFDPDLSPVTGHLTTRKYHAACKASGIRWATPSPLTIPAGPQLIGLPSSAQPDQVAELDLDARPVIYSGDPEHDGRAVLLLTARVIDDLGQGTAPWLTEFELFLRQHGFGHPGSFIDTRADEWSLRIEALHQPQWIALRTATADDGSVRGLLLRALELPDAWVEQARHDQEVTVVAGPCTSHWDEPGIDVGVAADELAKEHLEPEDPGGCRCALLDAAHVDELLEGSFVMGQISVVADEQVH